MHNAAAGNRIPPMQGVKAYSFSAGPLAAVFSCW